MRPVPAKETIFPIASKAHTDSGETSVLLMAKHTNDDLETTQQFRLWFLVVGAKIKGHI